MFVVRVILQISVTHVPVVFVIINLTGLLVVVLLFGGLLLFLDLEGFSRLLFWFSCHWIGTANCLLLFARFFLVYDFFDLIVFRKILLIDILDSFCFFLLIFILVLVQVVVLFVIYKPLSFEEVGFPLSLVHRLCLASWCLSLLVLDMVGVKFG